MMATAKATSSPAVMASFFDVERLRGLVVPEEQVPRFLVLIHASRLYRRRDVEHHDVLIVMGKNGGKIVPADGRRPGFDKCFDLALRGSALTHHGSHSDCLPMCVPRTNVEARIRQPETAFFCRRSRLSRLRQISREISLLGSSVGSAFRQVVSLSVSALGRGRPAR
jgi:hypothetical protein